MSFFVKESPFFAGADIPGDLAPERLRRPEAPFRANSAQENKAHFAAI